MLLLVALLCGFIVWSDGKDNIDGTQLTHYEYTVSNGYSGRRVTFMIEQKDSIVVAKVKDCSMLLDTCMVDSECEAPRELLETIGKMLVDAKVYKWENHYTNPDVFDGDSWSMDVAFGKQLFWSGGYMAWPNNDPTSEINSMIYKACNPKEE